MNLLCSEVRDSLAAKPVDVICVDFFRQAHALEPLWQLALDTWAVRLATPSDKLDAHAAALHSAFERMEGWLTKQSKMARKEEKAISSAISYLRNGAHDERTCDLLLSPIARNLAGLLRMCLHLASFNYDDSQIPAILACEVFELAATRMLYPIDLGNLTHYAPDSIHGEGGDIDNFNAMLRIGSHALKLDAEYERLNAEAKRLFTGFGTVRPLAFPTTLSAQRGGERNSELYIASMRAFHGSH